MRDDVHLRLYENAVQSYVGSEVEIVWVVSVHSLNKGVQLSTSINQWSTEDALHQLAQQSVPCIRILPNTYSDVVLHYPSPGLPNKRIRLDLWIESKRFGTCTLTLDPSSKCHEKRYLHIIDEHDDNVGVLAVDYLLVTNVTTDTRQLESEEYQFWKSQPRCIGHRGAGATYDGFGNMETTENTLAAFKRAAEHGADGVEFDVVMTSDCVPVIYHDYHVCIAAQTHDDSVKFIKMPIHKISFADLRSVKLYHTRALTCDTATVAKYRLPPDAMPTLNQLFEDVAEDLALNLEVKYSMEVEGGEHEAEDYYDKQFCSDAVVSALKALPGRRRIQISCFDPDICVMIAAKQVVYPVCLLSQGRQGRWVPYKDVRTTSLYSSANFALANKLFGVNMYSEELQLLPQMVKQCTDAGLLITVWGDALSNSETFEFFKKLGVTAFIVDYIKPAVASLRPVPAS